MKKSLIALTLLVSVCCLSSCNNNKEDTSSISDTSSVTSSETTQSSSSVKSSSSSSKSSSDSKSSATSGSSSVDNMDDLYNDDIYNFDDYDYDYDYDDYDWKYEEWKYADWQAATAEERKECLELFNDVTEQDSDESNLGKIFAANPDENLIEIIIMQLANQGDFEQADPGHGAAAGQNVE